MERNHGRKGAAALLGVDRRTLDAGLDGGLLSRRMRGALDRALQAGAGSPAAEQRDRNDKLEARLEEQGKEMRANNRASEDRDRAIREEMTQGFRGLEWRLAALDGGGAEANGAGTTAGKRATLRREFPDLVTLEPAEDDEEVFGDVWPLIVEWRELKTTHPNEGKSLSWLRTEVRFLALELALLEEHGLTLPPAEFPLRGFDRNGQVNWRRTALSDTRRKLRRREFLRGVRRVYVDGQLPAVVGADGSLGVAVGGGRKHDGHVGIATRCDADLPPDIRGAAVPFKPPRLHHLSSRNREGVVAKGLVALSGCTGCLIQARHGVGAVARQRYDDIVITARPDRDLPADVAGRIQPARLPYRGARDLED